jgi:hypothetical protein
MGGTPGTDGSSLRLCHLLRMESLMQWLNQMVTRAERVSAAGSACTNEHHCCLR